MNAKIEENIKQGSYYFNKKPIIDKEYCKKNKEVFKTTHGFPTMIANYCFRVAQKFTKGCRPLTLPTWPPWVHLHTQFEPKIISTDTISIRVSKAELFTLGGLVLLATSYQSHKRPAPILGRPLGST